MRVVVRVNMSSITKSPHQEFKLCPWIFDQVQQRDLAKLINSKSNNFTVKKQSVFRLHISSKTWVWEQGRSFFFFFLLNCILNLIFILYWGIVTYNVGLVSGVQQSVSVIHVWDYHWLSTNYMPGSLLDLHKDDFVPPSPESHEMLWIPALGTRKLPGSEPVAQSPGTHLCIMPWSLARSVIIKGSWQ